MADELDAAIGRRLRRRRRLMGKTQQQLGEQVGVRFQQIQKYESGANRVSAARLWSLSQALDVSMDYFFNQTAQPLTAEANTVGTGETIDLVRAFTAMDALPRKRMLSLARSLSNQSDSRAKSTTQPTMPAGVALPFTGDPLQR